MGVDHQPAGKVLLTESHRGGSNPPLTAIIYMKVCLLLSGQMRNADEVFPKFKSNLLDRYDTDVYISTWDSPNIYDSIKLFNPIAFEIENYESEFQTIFKDIVKDDEWKLETNANLVSACAMWYKTMRVHQLKQNRDRWFGYQYDVIIKTRPDILIEQPIELIEPSQNTIYIPKGWDWSEGIGDLMAYGDNKVMNEYCTLFYDFKSTIKSMDKINPERILKTYLNDFEEIKIERPEVDLTLRDMNIKTTYWFSQ